MFGKKHPDTEKETLASAPRRGIKKMDAIVTGLIFWGVIASIYGVRKGMEKKSGQKGDEQQLELFDTTEEPKKLSLWKRLFSQK